MNTHDRVALFRARLAADGQATVIAEGHSMWPAIVHGTRVTVYPVDPARLAVGDVVLATASRRWVMHRIIALSRGRVLLKGDANPRDDGWCSMENVIARLPQRPDDQLRAAVSAHVGPRLARLVGLCRRLSERLGTRR
jgi:signal peptidase I